MTAVRRSFLAPAAATIVLLLALVLGGPATAQPSWAPVDEATITPGVQMFTDGAQCTANFIFTSGGEVYIGYAAHCAGTGGSTETNGCDSGSLPLGTPVEVTGADALGSLAYSSWLAMQEEGETDAGACAGNDFALVRLDPADHDKVNPSIPFWGGPQGINTDGISLGESVYSYGNSSLRPVDSPLSRKEGLGVQTTNGGWTHTLYTLSPGIPGDSGSAFLDSEGRALGVVSTLAIAPLAGSNNIADINLALQYANAHGDLGTLSLVEGTEAFGAGVPLIGWLLG